MSNKRDSVESVIKDTFKQIKEIVDANIVIGKKVELNDNSVIIPVSKVSVGIITGGGEVLKRKGDCVGSSTGFNVTPIGFLSIVEGVVSFVSVGNSDSMAMTILDNLFKLTEKFIENNGGESEE